MHDEGELFQSAVDHHRAGHLEQAARGYQQVLRRSPQHPEALYLLGVVACQTGNAGPAVELLQRALAAGADAAPCHNILGLALTDLGKTAEAEASFGRAIALRRDPDFYNNLGILLNKQGRFDEAIAAYGEALALNPEYADAHYNAGNAHRAKQELDAAVECFRRAVSVDPEHGHGLAALAQTLQTLKRSQEALPFFEKACAIFPADADLRYQMGNALAGVEKIPEAAAAFQDALALNPRHAGAWYASGCAENLRKEYIAAVECFERALEIEPAWPEAQHNLGQALFELGRVNEAVDWMRRAAAGARPELPRAMLAVIIPGSSKSDHQAIFEARRAFAEHDLPRVAAKTPSRGARPGGRRLRIAYVSSFFHRENWMKPVWGLINHHDRRRCEIHLFSDAPASAIKGGYVAHPGDRVHDMTGLSNEAVAAQIEQAGIDLLVDLNGYSAMRRLPLPALRPAPVIAGWFNMYATTGMRCFDYLIGDEHVIPAEEEKFYCEKIVRVPGSYLTFEVSYPVPAVAPPPCLKSGAMTFGCLASQYKITPEVVAAWCRVLEQAPASCLLLKNAGLGSAGTRQYLGGLFEGYGIAPERLRLEGPSDHHEFLKTYDKVDVALDTFPYNGGTTTTEAIWQGVPVISFWGDRWAARTSASILRAGDLGEFVGSNLEEYIALAVTLANSPDTAGKLTEQRATLRQRLVDSPVCDTRRFAGEMEQLYFRMCGFP